MTAAELLRDLRALNVLLAVDGNRLRVSAPKGALTLELQEGLRQHKGEILGLLTATNRTSDMPPLEAVSRDEPPPLSSFQQRLWVLDRLDPASNAYHLVAWQKCTVPFDLDCIRASLTELAERHEILRTNFQAPDGAPHLVIRPPQPVDPHLLDWSALEVPDLDLRLREVATEEAQKPMDLAEGSLFRPTVVKVSSDSFALLITVHHIVTDAWSLGLMLAEWQARYLGHLGGASPEIPDLPLQYADYAAWQQATLEGGNAREKEAFWVTYLEGAPTVLTLPSDRPRGSTQVFDGGIHLFGIDEEVGEKLQKLCGEEGVTPFMVWLAAFGILLNRYSGQRDILIGSPVASRTVPVLETMLGPFVNTLVLRHSQRARDTGRELLGRTRENMLAAHGHQAVPFERLVDLIPSERTMAHPPIFQVSCAYHNQPGRSEFNVTAGGSMFELTLNGFEIGGQLAGSLEYNLALFDEATIQRMANHFRVILASLVKLPDSPVDQLPMVPEEEVRIVVETWNQTDSPTEADISFISTFETQAEETPHRIAVSIGEDELSYSEVNQRAEELGRRLRARGLQEGGVTAILLPRTLDLVVAPLAVMKAGGTYVPLDPDYPAARIEYILEDSGAGLVVTTTELSKGLPVGDLEAIAVDSPWTGEETSTPLPKHRAANDLAYLIYTSGTTGKPKGVEVTNGGLANVLASLGSAPGIGPGDTLLAVTTFAFDIAGVELFLPLTVGARVVVAPTEAVEHGKRLLALMEAVHPTVLQATPATWQMLMDAGWTPEVADRDMRVWCGGEALVRPLAEGLLDRSDGVWNLYGPTETTIWSTVWEVTRGAGPVPIGRPLFNTRALVLDALGAPAPIGVPGELFIGGAGVGRGYRNLPALTDERFIPDPMDSEGNNRFYRTGDLVRWNGQGTLEYLGRIDQQVKVRGHRIELGEIESVLIGHPSVQLAAAGVWDSRIVGYVVFEPGSEETASDIRRYLRGFLPEYMIPGFVVPLPELPMTDNRKLDRKRLPPPHAVGEGQGSKAFEPPSGDAEKAIAGIWQELLGEEIRVGANDNFFELGGHSLLALQAVYRIEELKGQPLDTRAIFFENLRQIAAR